MKRPDWEKDKAWSDLYLTEIKRILGEHLIGEPPQEEDAERNTDLIVLRMDPVRIACRVRRDSSALKYANDFTLRYSRPSGVKTELTKIVEGWGDYFFYGISGDACLACWALADLRVFRAWWARELYRRKGRLPGIEKENPDGSSTFRVFSWDDLPDDFVVARRQIAPPIQSQYVQVEAFI